MADEVPPSVAVPSVGPTMRVLVQDASSPVRGPRGASPGYPTWSAALLLLVVLELILLFAPTLHWLYGRWTLSVWHNAHGIFVLPFAAWLAYHELKAHRHPGAGSAWGFAFVIPALGLHALDAGMHTQLLSAVALLLMLPGLSLLLLGRARTRAILFPLAFTAFALPIPLALTESLHLALRQVGTNASAAILPLLGVTVFVEGTTIHTVRGGLQIVDACSGFSTLYAALAVACLTAHSSGSAWRRWLVIGAAAPIAIAANIVRILLLTVLVVWYGGEILETPLHPLSGLMTFALALPLIFWLGGSAVVPRSAAPD